MPRPVTFEHLAFPGMGRQEAVALQRELETMEAAARLFAVGLYGLDVDISWSLTRTRPSHWLKDRHGRLGAHLWVDLQSPVNHPAGSRPATPTAEDYKAAFRAGFLHALGRLTASPGPEADQPLERALRTSRLPQRLRAWMQTPAGDRLLVTAWERLEAARSDVLLMESYRGAARHLSGQLAWDEFVALAAGPPEQLLGLLALAIRARSGAMTSPDDLSVSTEVRAAYGSLAKLLPAIWREDAVGGGYQLASVLVRRIAPVLMDLAAAEASAGPGLLLEAAQVEDAPSPPLVALFHQPEISTQGAGEAIGTRVVFLPHSAGGEVMVRIDVAHAATLAPDPLNETVLQRLVDTYGNEARDALAQEAASLRRALRVNWERRRRGRYRSGKHIGMANLRRYLTVDDPRLFQRLEHPNELSYYFHLLVDASYSMLESDNGAKALAVAYAFTELLSSMRLPVDVTLYASGITQLYDHRTDSLEPYFGGDFGYLISGTMEMEAIAFAKMKADTIERDHKLFIVITDGTPVATTLPFVGTPSLAAYYRDTLIPWLRQSRIDLLALGIGLDPSYHENSVALTDSWDSLSVFAELVEELVAEGTRRTGELWR